MSCNFTSNMLRIFFVQILVVAACSGSPISSRILGGIDAKITDFPYMLSIELLDTGHYCGGVIVSADWLLTDAWCTDPPVAVHQYSVRSGSAVLGNGTRHSVVQWIHHPLSDTFFNEYDFALVQVEPPFEFGEDVAAVALPAQDEATPNGAVANVVGWGEVYGSFNLTSEQLQFANTTVFGDAECSDYLTFEYEASKLCTQDPDGQVAHCWRDEGGPLVVDGTLFGIALWPGVCNDPLEVEVYARVASVREWIDATTAA